MINRMFLLRLSTKPMTREQINFRRIAALPQVPKLQQIGQIEVAGELFYYTLLTLLPGCDVVEAYAATTIAQQEQLGHAVAHFLDRLHAHAGAHYEIGLYMPAIPGFTGTWLGGHRQYWAQLQAQSAVRVWQPAHDSVLARAFRFLDDNAHALEFQRGPKLLHNDFHPKNILVTQGGFSGVIDWECSQFGEADFDLCHLIHWCIYPPKPEIDFRPLLRGLFTATPHSAQVPDLATRLTIYQIEHEIQQMLWQGNRAEAERVPRLQAWLDGSVAQLLSNVYEHQIDKSPKSDTLTPV